MSHHCYYCGEPLLDADMVVRLGFDGATECDCARDIYDHIITSGSDSDE